MRKIKRRWIVLGLVLLSAPAAALVAWLGLSLEPAFYRDRVEMTPARRQAEAKRFVAQSLQLRNDIVNEPRWEAAFGEDEVNAWLAEDLVAHFADQIPPGVREPRVAFEAGRVTFAFRLTEGPIRTVVWVVARPRVPEGNTLALTVEKIRAGVLPIPADGLLDRISAAAQAHGLDLKWERDNGQPVAILRYTPDPSRSDVVLERLQVLDGQIRLGGRSNKRRGAIARPTLPTRRVLQSTFPLPHRRYQPIPVSLRQSSNRPRR